MSAGLTGGEEKTTHADNPRCCAAVGRGRCKNDKKPDFQLCEKHFQQSRRGFVTVVGGKAIIYKLSDLAFLHN